MSREAVGLARAAMLLASLWVVFPSVAWADAVWEFVDGDGVVHMGNGSPPPASRGVTWLSRIPSIKTDRVGKEREPSALQFPGFDAAKPQPVRWADQLFKGFGARGAWGIMFDDLVAAFCTLLVIAVWRF